MKKLFFIILFFGVEVLQAQNIRNSSISIDFFVGQHIEHDKKLKDAIENNSYGIMLSWNDASSKNTKFNNLFNYPEKGFSFLYHNFNSSVLGEVFGVYRHYNFHLTPKRKHQLNLATGFGIGYATEKYDAIKNPTNFAIGSHLLASAFLKLKFLKYFENNNWSLNSSIGLLHFSNMSYKNPNLGINTLTFSLGVTKKLAEKNFQRETVLVDENASKINYNIVFRSGVNESKNINSGLHPFYTFTFYSTKQLNPYSTLTAGIDVFNSKFLKDYIDEDEQNNTEIEVDNETLRSGIFIGHELTMNHFSFISQLGVAVYYPVKYESRVYERFGFKYKLGKHFFSEISLKINLFRAEALEFGIGYRI